MNSENNKRCSVIGFNIFGSYVVTLDESEIIDDTFNFILYWKQDVMCGSWRKVDHDRVR